MTILSKIQVPLKHAGPKVISAGSRSGHSIIVEEGVSGGLGSGKCEGVTGECKAGESKEGELDEDGIGGGIGGIGIGVTDSQI